MLFLNTLVFEKKAISKLSFEITITTEKNKLRNVNRKILYWHITQQMKNKMHLNEISFYRVSSLCIISTAQNVND